MDGNGSNLSSFTQNQETAFTDCEDAFCIFTFVLYFLTIALIMVLNPVCLVVLRHVRGIQETTKLFMMSLTLSDLCAGIFFGIPHLYYFISTSWIVSDSFCKISPYLVTALVTVNALSMVSLTIDRFLAIAYPLHYPRLMTLKRSKVMIALLWSLTIILHSALYCLPSSQSETVKEKHAILCATHNMTQFFTSSIAGVSLGTILILYAYILKVARRQARLIAAQNILGNIEGRQNIPGSISTKSATTVIIITGTACLCWIPGIITSSLASQDFKVSLSVQIITTTLYSSNCWLNCIIYYWRNREFKQALHNLRSSCCH
ncbi:G-protein coupled receptor 52-like [Asterias rubens]|uniref:G-protein coupled receptor 52-like n=1 Tax=Asterias rubens TaxID=7604 RepID=UPI0014551A43|nr:G-protein coupled receptor 52-like [Asterias rubens]